MGPDGAADLTANMEMITKEATAYLSGPAGFTLSTKLMYLLRSLHEGPIAEKRGARPVHRKAALDAFLRENGTHMTGWTEGMWREVADDLRRISTAAPDMNFGPLIETLEIRDPVDWDPDEAS